MTVTRKAILATALLLATTAASQAAPNVVATIKPIHSLVAAVMEGVGVPQLLVKGGASPHSYTLRPSDAAALEQADVVVWTGHGMELFLEGALGSLAGDALLLELAEHPGLVTYPPREGGSFEAEAHEEGEHEHGESGTDMHFWLDPENAAVIVTAIADTLSKADPANAAAYAANAEKENAELAALSAELQAALAGAQGKPFLVFHDAYQYFEKRFGLTIAGTLTVNPEVTPGAQRISELKARVAGLGATCVFAEPQFAPAILSAITEGTQAKTGTLDPEGANLAEGPGLYAELLRGIAGSISECLSR